MKHAINKIKLFQLNSHKLKIHRTALTIFTTKLPFKCYFESSVVICIQIMHATFTEMCNGLYLGTLIK